MAAWAASDGLATPLPPVYVEAARSVSFSLFRWTCPFSHMDFTNYAENPNQPTLVNQTQTNGTLFDPATGAFNTDLQVGVNTKGRRLMGADSMVTRALCGKGFADGVKRLERVRRYQAGWAVLADRDVPQEGAQGGALLSVFDPPGRVLLQIGGSRVAARLPTNQTTTVSVVATDGKNNGTSVELPEKLYASLLTDGKAVYGFLQGNLPSSTDKG
jgi:hypothetical protein